MATSPASSAGCNSRAGRFVPPGRRKGNRAYRTCQNERILLAPAAESAAGARRRKCRREIRKREIMGNIGLGGILRMVAVGLIVGILARFFYPGPVHMGLILSI